MEKLLKGMNVVDGLIMKFIKIITMLCLGLLFLIVMGKILIQFIPWAPAIQWTDEIIELLFAGLVFYGAAGVWMIKGHFSVGDWVAKLAKTERGVLIYALVVDLISMIFIGLLCYYSIGLIQRTRELTPVFQIPKKYFYLGVPISSCIMMIYSLFFVIRTTIKIIHPDADDIEPRGSSGKKQV